LDHDRADDAEHQGSLINHHVMIYSLTQFIVDLRSITAATTEEREILQRVAPLAERLATSPELLDERPASSITEQGFSFSLLHEETDHSLAVAVLSWLPSGATLPHNHGTWGVVVGLAGAERNIFWRRNDDGSRPGYAELERLGEMEFVLGRAVVLPSATIHSVENDSGHASVSLHVYGKNVYYTGRLQFDVTNKRELPWGIPVS
jgi:predicted metal-dependent enzyme (double-stranded beta helix superfamily)